MPCRLLRPRKILNGSFSSAVLPLLQHVDVRSVVPNGLRRQAENRVIAVSLVRNWRTNRLRKSGNQAFCDIDDSRRFGDAAWHTYGAHWQVRGIEFFKNGLEGHSGPRSLPSPPPCRRTGYDSHGIQLHAGSVDDQHIFRRHRLQCWRKRVTLIQRVANQRNANSQCRPRALGWRCVQSFLRNMFSSDLMANIENSGTGQDGGLRQI